MKKLLFVCALCFSSMLYAMEASSPDKPIEIGDKEVSISDASLEDITPKSVEDYFDEFKDKFGIQYYETIDGRTFYNGYADVLVKEKDADFAKALQNAYSRAVLNMQSEFVRDAFGRISTEKVNSYFSDNSTNAKEFEDLPKGNKIDQILDKLAKLTSAKLDNALKDLGINSDSLTSEEQKKTLLRDKFISTNITKALGSMAGLVPVQTVITQTKRGNYRVGVIAVVSDKTRQIARDMQLGRESKIKGHGKPILDYLPKNKKGFLQEYGIRLIYDENGAPVILSYGNWGYVTNSTDSRIVDRLESVAKDTALQQADAAIIEFINTTISLNDKRMNGEDLQHIIKQTENLNDGAVEQKEQVISNVIDQVNKTIKTTAKGKIRGIRTIKKWEYTDENGIEHVGVVRAYSYNNVKNINESLNPKKKSADPKPSVKIQSKSNIVNSIDDF